MARRTRRKSTRRKSNRRSRRSEGGGWSLDPSRAISAGYLENTAYTGAGKDCAGSVVRPGFISGMPGMKGGRYEMNPGALLSNGSDIGMSGPASHHSIACERGSTNSLNMRGGAHLAGAPVAVGAADSMRYNAPTAGYGHGFQTLPGSAVGGLMLNVPYDARGYNPACSKTGGGNVADSAAPYSALQAGQLTGRGGFDGSKGGLPVKYGGKRRTHRRKHRKHSRK